MEAVIRTVDCAAGRAKGEMIGTEPAVTVSAGFLTIDTNHLLAKGACLDTTGMADTLLTVMAAFAATGMNSMMVVAQG
jgi:hypothetical protein